MKCPYCFFVESKVVDSRPSDEGATIRRRRECLHCARRFTTYETVETLPLMVIKHDGGRQAFDREKLVRGMSRACEKRPISTELLREIAVDIEQAIQNSMTREIPSDTVGEMVLERLRGIDEVAYVRFASVYRQFRDMESFLSELQKLKEGH